MLQKTPVALLATGPVDCSLYCLTHTGLHTHNSNKIILITYLPLLFRMSLNLLKPNDIYICRTAALTSRRYILNIYSRNIRTEYFKHAA